MAQRVQVLLVDDLDGGEADETVTFAIDGVTYEIDLTTANADKLRGLLTPYAESGRRTGGRTARGRTAIAKTSAGNSDTAKIRAWAKEKGYEINDRGRVPATIREAYEKAQANGGQNKPAPVAAPPQAAEPQQTPEPEPSRDERVANKTAAANSTPAKRAARKPVARGAKKTAATS